NARLEPIPEGTFGGYMLAKERKKQEHAEKVRQYKRTYHDRIMQLTRPEWEEVCHARGLDLNTTIQAVKARQFPTLKALAEHLGKPQWYATGLIELLRREKLVKRSWCLQRRQRKGASTH
ncbi:MAG: hypothetical protein OEY63_07365, partial [Gemmatimonadota bacterium]|nr:hypothetical protein [Gemmatimonadota bacterium]